MDRDYYQMMGVARDALPEDIKKAYRKRAKDLHPDLHPDDPDAGLNFSRLQDAYAVLSDPVERRRYDASLSSDAVSLHDMLRDVASMFAQSSHFHPEDPHASGQAYRRPANPDPEGLNIKHTVKLTLADIYRSACPLTYVRRVSAGDTLQEVEETIDLTKMATLVLASRKPFVSMVGMGHYSLAQQKYGNLEIVIDYVPETGYVVVWDSLTLVRQFQIDVSEVLATERLSFEHFGEQILVPTDKFRSDKTEFRVPGYGLPDGAGNRGDLIIQYVISFDMAKIPEDVRKVIRQYYKERNDMVEREVEEKRRTAQPMPEDKA